MRNKNSWPDQRSSFLHSQCAGSIFFVNVLLFDLSVCLSVSLSGFIILFQLLLVLVYLSKSSRENLSSFLPSFLFLSVTMYLCHKCSFYLFLSLSVFFSNLLFLACHAIDDLNIPNPWDGNKTFKPTFKFRLISSLNSQEKV